MKIAKIISKRGEIELSINEKASIDVVVGMLLEILNEMKKFKGCHLESELYDNWYCFGYNTLDDFMYKIRSLKNAYLVIGEQEDE